MNGDTNVHCNTHVYSSCQTDPGGEKGTKLILICYFKNDNFFATLFFAFRPSCPQRFLVGQRKAKRIF